MTFKRHAMGDIKDRPVSEQFEADFHQLLVPALERSRYMGNKKKQGYIMGAFRDALKAYRIVRADNALQSIIVTPHERNFLLNALNKLQEGYKELEDNAPLPEDRKDAGRFHDLCSAIKVKLVVLSLMEHKE